jgi:IMP and pyridine-specific 5'-nucleotidase
LKSYCPSIGHFFTPLKLKGAFLQQDHQYHISQRKLVPPSFNDIRRILNCAQVSAIAGQLKLLTFDGDVTLYEDGGDLKRSSPLVDMIIRLLMDEVCVAIVTAAGYLQPERYEQRLHGLIEGLQ